MTANSKTEKKNNLKIEIKSNSKTSQMKNESKIMISRSTSRKENRGKRKKPAKL